jgi:cell division septation protein DedD
MSRLDYLTIAIVGACILAIIFLVYKMTDLFNSGKQDDKIESLKDSVETETDDVYDYEIEEKVDSTGGNATSDNATSTQPAATNSATATTATTEPPTSDELDASASPSEDDNTGGGKSYGGNYSYPGGAFMVIAGAFTQKASARKEVDRLKKKGYATAGLEIFDRGKYAVVLVDQFGNMADAERLVKKLQGDGIKAYIKMKQPG